MQPKVHKALICKVEGVLKRMVTQPSAISVHFCIRLRTSPEHKVCELMIDSLLLTRGRSNCAILSNACFVSASPAMLYAVSFALPHPMRVESNEAQCTVSFRV